VKFLLDTDHISILQRQTGSEFLALSTRIAQQQAADLAFSVVGFHEQVLGCHTYLSRARTSANPDYSFMLLSHRRHSCPVRNQAFKRGGWLSARTTPLPPDVFVVL
jgi:hypothetical protein